MIKKIIVVVMISFLLVFSASAHQPRIVDEEITTIVNPDISQAFYGILKRVPNTFNVIVPEAQELYVQILVPDIPGIDKDVSARISQDNVVLSELRAADAAWSPFFEAFAGDNYFEGPDARILVEAGTYTIQVESPDNQGRYVLVVGEKEVFPFNEIVNTVKVLPGLKKNFFQKSAWTAYNNLTGLFLGISLVVVVLIVLVLMYVRIKNKK